MSLPNKWLTALVSVLFSFALFSTNLHAQFELTHISGKGYSSVGYGAFLHVGFPVAKGDEIGLEAGILTSSDHDNHVNLVPLLVSYRYTFDRSGARWYAEPAAGYVAGASDIQRTTANGNLIYDSNGKEVDQKVTGPSAGLTLGYILPFAAAPINFGLRYQHIFVSGGDPSLNAFSFRISWALHAGRRLASARTGQSGQ